MKIAANKRLFWFLKEGAELDLEDPAMLEMYVQQVLTRGRTQDIRTLLEIIGRNRFREVFSKIRRFLPQDVRSFWDDSLGTD